MALDISSSFKINASVSGQQEVDRLNDKVKRLASTSTLSAGQISAAFRQLPMQFTDVVVSLAGGQSPFLVLLQQGGQVKDSFGGIMNMFRAFATYLTPANLAIGGTAVAVTSLAAAYYMGSEEADRFHEAIVSTGNAAGVTADQLAAMAQQIDQTFGVTAAQGAEALAALTATGRVARGNLKEFAEATISYSRALGIEVKDIAKNFAELGKDPVEASRKLNDSMNYLTASVYEQIRALDEQGKTQQAAQLAQETYAAALKARASEIGENLGYIESAWRSVTSMAREAWDAMLNVGREDSLEEQLADARARLEGRLKAQRSARPHHRALYQPTIDALREQISTLEESIRLQARAADAAAERVRKEREAINKIDEEYEERKKKKRQPRERESEFERLKERLESQLRTTKELSVAETLLEEIQSGRYKTLTKPQQDALLNLAKEIDYRKTLAEYEEAEKKRIEEITRRREQASEAERRQNEAAKRRWIDLIDPTNKYIRQLEEIRELVSKGVLTPEQGFEAEFRVQEQIDELMRLKDEGKDAFKELERAIEGWGKKATDTFIEFAFTGKASFSDLVNSILKDIARMMIQTNVTAPLFKAIQGFDWRSLFPFANGGIMTSDGPVPLRKYASGGIANSPQLALYGEGSKPEAYVPLPDGRSIPVTLTDRAPEASSPIYNITVPVNVEGGSPQVADQSGAGVLGKAIAAAVRAELINQRRPGGLLAA